jgi:hypothetical protein
VILECNSNLVYWDFYLDDVVIRILEESSPIATTTNVAGTVTRDLKTLSLPRSYFGMRSKYMANSQHA